MEVSGQLHAPTALPPVSIGYEAKETKIITFDWVRDY